MPNQGMGSAGSVQLLTGYEELKNLYEGAKVPFEVLTHPYLSTGAFRFDVVNSVVDAGGFTRLVLKCPRQTSVELFSYGLGDTGTGAGLSGVFPATDAETNISERHQTNNEDFAIEGVSLHVRGVRVSYPQIGANLFIGDTTTPGLHSAIQNGDVNITDIASTIVPPEISSPLALQDALMSALRSKVSFAPVFDRKVTDHVARFDKFPEGGANSYLMANGEPSHHNFFRLHENYVWRKTGADRDKIFSINLRCEDDCYFFCTQPSLYQPTTPPASILGPLKTVWIEFTMYMHGRAFYIPSANI
jgi:hypothetical protein